MGTLFSALNSNLDALRAFQQALNISQNNVSNSATPGYARQIATFSAEPFNLKNGLTGGVILGPTQSTDSAYQDQAVRNQFEAQGNFAAQTNALGSIETLFDVSGQTGVLGSLNQLFQSFSAWSGTPDSASAQAVLTAAQNLAQSFNSASKSLAQTTQNLNGQISSTVQQINAIASNIQKDNALIDQSPTPDAGVQADLRASLDALSQLTDATVQWAPNGAATVLIGGQTPLVIGSTQYKVSASFTDATPGPNANATQDAHILDASGNDIASTISGGSLGGLLTVRNTVLPELQGNGTQAGALNQLAKQVADRVNSILTAAQTPAGQPGSPLFAYSNASPVDVAATLSLDPKITPAGLAPVQPGPPQVGNGAAIELADLGDSTAAGDTINGLTINQFAAGIATQVGQQSSDAQTGQQIHATLLAQAQALQTQISGVSLDQEAIQVIQLQKGYDAAGKMVSVIDSMASTLINMLPAA